MKHATKKPNPAVNSGARIERAALRRLLGKAAKDGVIDDGQRDDLLSRIDAYVKRTQKREGGIGRK